MYVGFFFFFIYKTLFHKKVFLYANKERQRARSLFLCPCSLLISNAMESHHISAWGFQQNKRHDVMVSAIVWATLRLCEPTRVWGNSRRLKESAKEPPPSSLPLRCTIEAAARRLGKVWQPKRIQGSVKHRLVSSASTCYGQGWAQWMWKGEHSAWVTKLANRLWPALWDEI